MSNPETKGGQKEERFRKKKNQGRGKEEKKRKGTGKRKGEREGQI